jgi:hypothetical protein
MHSLKSGLLSLPYSIFQANLQRGLTWLIIIAIPGKRHTLVTITFQLPQDSELVDCKLNGEWMNMGFVRVQ